MRHNKDANAPDPAEVKNARAMAGLTQPDASAKVHVTLRTWQNYESGACPMHPGLWELFQIKTRM